MENLREYNLLPCAYKTLFGIDCPLCGFQRALVLLLHGDIKQSFLIYPPLLPAVFLIMIFVLHLLNNKLLKFNEIKLYINGRYILLINNYEYILVNKMMLHNKMIDKIE